MTYLINWLHRRSTHSRNNHMKFSTYCKRHFQVQPKWNSSLKKRSLPQRKCQFSLHQCPFLLQPQRKFPLHNWPFPLHNYSFSLHFCTHDKSLHLNNERCNMNKSLCSSVHFHLSNVGKGHKILTGHFHTKMITLESCQFHTDFTTSPSPMVWKLHWKRPKWRVSEVKHTVEHDQCCSNETIIPPMIVPRVP